jgi:Na+-driven multidrug efflux pump
MPNALRAAGDANYCMYVAIPSMWIVRVLGAYVMAYTLKLGVLGMWYAMIADWIVRGIFYTQRWIRGRWMAKQII